ncbi:Immunoglobulin superfamily DCC subclass member 3, partial [Ophiophagus hannah]
MASFREWLNLGPSTKMMGSGRETGLGSRHPLADPRGRGLEWSRDGWMAGELAFILEPSDVIAVRDRPLILHCQVEGEAPIRITWYRDGVALSNDSHTALSANGSLRLDSVHRRPRGGSLKEDAMNSSAGEYSCTAQNCYGLLVSRKARIQIASQSPDFQRAANKIVRLCSNCDHRCLSFLPKALSKFHMHPESMSVEEGGVARFQCLIQGVPEATITWEHNRTVLSTEDYRFTLLPAGILQITGARQSDVGTYRCVARNIANTRYSQEAALSISGEHRGVCVGLELDGWTDLVNGWLLWEGTQSEPSWEVLVVFTGNTNRARIVLLVAKIISLSLSVPKVFKEPVILSGPQNLTITVHQTAILECIATGNPRPIVSWSRLAPPEFVQWPQSLSKTPGTSAIFTCVAQGVPEPHLVWLKNGKVLAPGDNIKLTHNNSAGTNQASARLAVALSKELPSSPEGVQAVALSTTSIRVSWQEPSREVTESIIGYVLHIRKAGAVVLNSWRGYPLELLPGAAPMLALSSPQNPRPATRSDSWPSTAMGTGTAAGASSPSRTTRSSWSIPPTRSSFSAEANSVCQCRQDGDASLAGIVVGVHIGMACIIFCVLFLMFGYRKSLFCKKGAQENWTVPQGTELVSSSSQDPRLNLRKPDSRAKPPEMMELVARVRTIWWLRWSKFWRWS